MIEIVHGDVLNVRASAICHQVNCQNVMGSGVAKSIYTRWPEVKEKYHSFSAGKNPSELLGKIQIVDLSAYPNRSRVVVNIFGQLNYGRDGKCYTRYDALERAFTELNHAFRASTIAFPYGFGCGLAGGDWETVEKLMITHLRDCNVIICVKE